MRTTSKTTKATKNTQSKKLSPADELCKRAAEIFNKILAEIKPNRYYLDIHDHQYVIKYLYYIRKAIERKYLPHACDYYERWKEELCKVDVQKLVTLPSTSEADKVMEEVKNHKWEYSNYDWDDDDDDFIEDVAYESDGFDIEFDADKEYNAERDIAEAIRKRTNPSCVQELPVENLFTLNKEELVTWVRLLIETISGMKGQIKELKCQIDELGSLKKYTKELEDLSQKNREEEERIAKEQKELYNCLNKPLTFDEDGMAAVHRVKENTMRRREMERRYGNEDEWAFWDYPNIY